MNQGRIIGQSRLHAGAVDKALWVVAAIVLVTAGWYFAELFLMD